jgi:hypothetical protein
MRNIYPLPLFYSGKVVSFTDATDQCAILAKRGPIDPSGYRASGGVSG